MQKPPQNVAYLYGSLELFFLCSPTCPKQPRTSFPFYKFFYPTISARISELRRPFEEEGFVCNYPVQMGCQYSGYPWTPRFRRPFTKARGEVISTLLVNQADKATVPTTHHGIHTQSCWYLIVKKLWGVREFCCVFFCSAPTSSWKWS